MSKHYRSSSSCLPVAHSIFLRLPLGAGSSGVLVYVTVRVTTWRMLTLRGTPDSGGSP